MSDITVKVIYCQKAVKQPSSSQSGSSACENLSFFFLVFMHCLCFWSQSAEVKSPSKDFQYL